MPALSFAPAISLFAAIHRVSPVGPLRVWLRTAEEKFHPPRRLAYTPQQRQRQDEVIASGSAGLHQLATIVHERGRGGTPTIVLGGFVPDATEQVFLLRRFFLRSGDLYCVNYPRNGFSLDLLCAQLDDLVDELSARGQPPVIFAVSFGGGLALEWLRRARVEGIGHTIAGLLLVSPVACVADLIAPGARKPATLLGRALRPYLDAGPDDLRPEVVEKSRTIFSRMFEAGAQNKAALIALMTKTELARLSAGVFGVIRGITARGAHERVQALKAMHSPSDYFTPALLPLARTPALVLFAEDESFVLDPQSPTRFAFERAAPAYFPRGVVQHVRQLFGSSPVQHASLIFHIAAFLPPIASFYRRLKTQRLRTAA